MSLLEALGREKTGATALAQPRVALDFLPYSVLRQWAFGTSLADLVMHVHQPRGLQEGPPGTLVLILYLRLAPGWVARAPTTWH